MSSPYNKPVLHINEQLNLLSDRGLVVGDRDFAHTFLSNVSYYRLSAYWWDLCIDKEHKKFREGVTFEDIAARYTFDRKLRLIVLDALKRVEVALRTKMIYFLSHSEGWFWHEKSSVFQDEVNFGKNLKSIKRELLRSKETFVKEHRTKYDKHSFPSLKAVEVINFGTLSKLFNNLRHDHPSKGKISNSMGLTSPKELKAILYALTYLRNTSAHHGRLWNRPVITTPSWIKKPKSEWLSQKPTENERRKIYYSSCCLIYLCDQVSKGHSLKERLKMVIDNRPDTIFLSSMGIPEDWTSQPLWNS